MHTDRQATYNMSKNQLDYESRLHWSKSRRPTGQTVLVKHSTLTVLAMCIISSYIPTPANANFALGSDAVRGQLKVLYPVTRWSMGRNPIGRHAMKTCETWSTDGILWCQTFSNIVHIIRNSLESSENAYYSTVVRHHRNRLDYFLSEIHNKAK